jgi:hypothetical protein
MRRRRGAGPPRKPLSRENDMPGTVKVLLMAADSQDGAAGLRLDREIRGAVEAVRTGAAGGRVEIHSRLAVQSDDWRRALLEHDPHVVHFSGHGSAKGLFLDRSDEVLPTAELAALFVPHRRVRVVVLNACRTHDVARALNDVVDYTVAMELAIDDSAAVVFSGAFYEALAAGRTVPTAFDTARAALKGRYTEKHALPRLLMREGADQSPVLPPAPVEEPFAGQVNRFRNVNAGSADISNDESRDAPAGRGQLNQMDGVTVGGTLTVRNNRS